MRTLTIFSFVLLIFIVLSAFGNEHYMNIVLISYPAIGHVHVKHMKPDSAPDCDFIIFFVCNLGAPYMIFVSYNTILHKIIIYIF